MNRLATIVPILALCALSVTFNACRRADLTEPDLVWTAIDVNAPDQQADAHLLRLNHCINILIDTGHPASAARLLEFLLSQGVSRLSAVIISHGHRDHYGGLLHLLTNNISVATVYFNPPAAELVAGEPWGCSQEEIDEIIAELNNRNIPLLKMTDQTQWIFDNGIKLEVLYVHDGLSPPIGRTDINDTSAVIMLTHQRLKFLFTGDLNARLGEIIVNNQEQRPVKADVLKVPHHGTESFPADAFFAAVAPTAMIVPAPEKLWLSERSQRMRGLASRCATYVNGLDGDIVVRSNGRHYRIECRVVPNYSERPDTNQDRNENQKNADHARF